MSHKQYSQTLNPQLAVQDYLNDLLQQMPSTSVLDELKKADDEKEAMHAEKLAKMAAEKRAKTQNKPHESTVKNTVNRAQQSPAVSSYSAVPDKSLASQRLEKKRAQSRAPQSEFREPLILKTAPILNRVFKEAPAPIAVPTPKVDNGAELPTLNSVTEKRHEGSLANARNDKVLTAEKRAVEPKPKPKPETVSAPDKPTVHRPISDNISNTTKLEAPEPIKQWLTKGKPEWAQGRFECLIFTVAGLKLAVPLVSLGAIHTIDNELTPLVGRPPWFLGLLTLGGRNIRVVDSAQWIMPERYTESVKDNYKFVIRLNDSDWGLACDSVAQSFSISPEEVRWRTDRGKRPWLAGTVIEHMCALMDVAAVSWLLDDAEKNQLSPI